MQPYTINDLYELMSGLNRFLKENPITDYVKNLKRTLPSTPNSIPYTNAPVYLKSIENTLSKFHISKTKVAQENILELFGFEKYLGDSGLNYYEKLYNVVGNGDSYSFEVINNIVDDLDRLVGLAKDFTDNLSYFNSEFLSNEDEDVTIMEIVFDGGASIDNFNEAKKLMEDWKLIIYGYSLALGEASEDFEIISIKKASPATFKIKTLKKNATFILLMLTGITAIQKATLENRILSAQLNKSNIIDDVDLQAKFNQALEERITKTMNERIQKTVDQTVEKYKTADKEAVKAALTKSIEKQYNFETHGGIVNIYISEPSPEESEAIANLKENKIELIDAKKKLQELSLEAPKHLIESTNENDTQ